MLLEIVVWSARYEKTEAPPALVRRMRTRREEVLAEFKAGLRSGRGRREYMSS